MKLSSTSVAYTGSKRKPGVTVTFNDVKLVKNTDYTLSYKKNIEVGTATVTVTGKGSYKGTAVKTFRIYEDTAANKLQLNEDLKAVASGSGFMSTWAVPRSGSSPAPSPGLTPTPANPSGNSWNWWGWWSIGSWFWGF